MGENRLTDSICSLSWINQKTGLPEHDGDGPSDILPGVSLTYENDLLPFRFLNLLEATVSVSGSPPRILSGSFTQGSSIYKNPSFAGIKSEAFETQQSKTKLADKMVFKQTVGARTVSAETIGEDAGLVLSGVLSSFVFKKVGRAVAHALMGYPPIWTTLQLTMYADGRSEGVVLCNSLFPSMNSYTHSGGTAGMPRLVSVYKQRGISYNAVPRLGDWQTGGWGALRGSTGPCGGNPWGLSKDDLTIREVAPGKKMA